MLSPLICPLSDVIEIAVTIFNYNNCQNSGSLIGSLCGRRNRGRDRGVREAGKHEGGIGEREHLLQKPPLINFRPMVFS